MSNPVDHLTLLLALSQPESRPAARYTMCLSAPHRKALDEATKNLAAAEADEAAQKVAGTKSSRRMNEPSALEAARAAYDSAHDEASQFAVNIVLHGLTSDEFEQIIADAPEDGKMTTADYNRRVVTRAFSHVESLDGQRIDGYTAEHFAAATMQLVAGDLTDMVLAVSEASGGTAFPTSRK